MSKLMFLFSLVYAILALATMLFSVELVLTVFNKPLIPADFWQTEWIAKLFVEWEMDNVGMFLSGMIIFAQFACLVLYFICRKIGNSIMRDQRQYDSADDFHSFVRKNLLLFSLGSVFLFLSVFGHIIECIPRGEGTEIVLISIFIGVPGLIFGAFVLPSAFGVIFFGEPNEHSFCESCNCGSLRQFVMSDSQHLHDRVEYQTTTTRRGDNVSVNTREVGRKRVNRNTYSCRNCDSSFEKVEAENI